MKRKMLSKIVVFTLGVISIASIVPKGIEAKADINNGWNNEGGNWYYYENGAKKNGWFVDNGKWYVTDENSAMKTGWYNTGGEWYFFDNERGETCVALNKHEIIESEGFSSVRCAKNAYVVRLSASGYLDCTEWTVFESESEALRYACEQIETD